MSVYGEMKRMSDDQNNRKSRENDRQSRSFRCTDKKRQ